MTTMSKYVPQLTHAQRRERREQIVERIRDGEEPEVVAAALGLTTGTVRRIAVDAGIVFPPRPSRRYGRSNSFRVLRLMIDGSPVADIIRDLGVSRQRIHQIRLLAQAAGFDV